MKKSNRISAIVNCLQRLRIRRSIFGATNDDEGIALITGLDTVVFGTVSAAEAVSLCNFRPPQYFWYMVSGFMCDCVQFLIDYALHFHVDDASTCWALSFCISILGRHTSHRYLVFGDYVGGYWKSLARMYAGYSIIIVVSTIFNIVMTKMAHMSHYAAWIVTLLWTGIVNYFILKRLWSFGGKASPMPRKETGGQIAAMNTV